MFNKVNFLSSTNIISQLLNHQRMEPIRICEWWICSDNESMKCEYAQAFGLRLRCEGTSFSPQTIKLKKLL